MMIDPQPISLSFEFFPPKNDAGRDSLLVEATKLAVLRPKFVTVTFGAGGSTKSGTFETALFLQKELGLTVGAHLSYFGTPKAELFAYADKLWENNIRHLVALRGDLPDGQSFSDYGEPDYFEYTSEFVEALLERHPFDISVGAYPEKHPDAPSLAADIIALQKKCDAGAARAITQFFFETSVFQNFLTKTGQAGIYTQIVPGLLPIHDLQKICGFAEKCQAHVPDSVKKMFTSSSENAGVHLLATQIAELRTIGVTHFHFYTLNQSDMIIRACQQAGIRP
ncbi:MAG TPA: methylenetetrahydrofolate reductase [Alphaproteobacteria bacterium]|nr:methylenetetrahydrofolate reductase [Alphaproteobacteria bacterium]HRK97057.1 methylenetetrahydrofolate reductase [Alphaproteobacteria bacterium]